MVVIPYLVRQHQLHLLVVAVVEFIQLLLTRRQMAGLVAVVEDMIILAEPE
jgi:hypothetical protein